MNRETMFGLTDGTPVTTHRSPSQVLLASPHRRVCLQTGIWDASQHSLLHHRRLWPRERLGHREVKANWRPDSSNINTAAYHLCWAGPLQRWSCLGHSDSYKSNMLIGSLVRIWMEYFSGLMVFYLGQTSIAVCLPGKVMWPPELQLQAKTEVWK